MPKITEETASDHACPYNDFNPCLGARCMAWQWVGPDVERCTTNNVVATAEGERPVGDPSTPEGSGWEADGAPYPTTYHRSKKDGLPPGTAQRWIRRNRVLEGNCARHPGDSYYGGGW